MRPTSVPSEAETEPAAVTDEPSAATAQPTAVSGDQSAQPLPAAEADTEMPEAAPPEPPSAPAPEVAAEEGGMEYEVLNDEEDEDLQTALALSASEQVAFAG